MNEALGKTYKDKITGMQGVCTGRAEYISGCDQLLLQPVDKKADGDIRESRWFDVQRCEPVKAELVVLDNGKTPGADREAPRR